MTEFASREVIQVLKADIVSKIGKGKHINMASPSRDRMVVLGKRELNASSKPNEYYPVVAISEVSFKGIQSFSHGTLGPTSGAPNREYIIFERGDKKDLAVGVRRRIRSEEGAEVIVDVLDEERTLSLRRYIASLKPL